VRLLQLDHSYSTTVKTFDHLLLLGRIAVLHTYKLMRPIVTDRVAWSVDLFVGRSVTLVSPAKSAEPIEMPFGLRTRSQGTMY